MSHLLNSPVTFFLRRLNEIIYVQYIVNTWYIFNAQYILGVAAAITDLIYKQAQGPDLEIGAVHKKTFLV